MLATEDAKAKVWITKYALTMGVFSVDAKISNSMVYWRDVGSGHNSYAHGEGRDWHRTESAALKRAEDMRKRKIESLRRSIKKFEKMTFTT